MAMADLIPTGRTSLVKKGNIALQVQTEYAYRPMPRITTTVQNSGQVLQKIERALERPISTIEEKNRMETTIRKQHAEVIAIIEKNGNLEQPKAAPRPETRKIPTKEATEPKPYPEPAPSLSISEQLERLPGHHQIFYLDSEGNFENAKLSKDFKRVFKPIFKNLHDLIQIFAMLPGVVPTRETGVFEIEKDKLYLVSSGIELLIFYLEYPDYSIEYEREIAEILKK